MAADFSPDGKRVAFLSDRGDEDAEAQVWIDAVTRAKRHKLTSFRGVSSISTGRRTERRSP